MNATILRYLIENYIYQMLPGTIIEREVTTGNSNKFVSKSDGFTGCKISGDPKKYHFILRRGQRFTEEEYGIMQCFVEEMMNLSGFYEEPYRKDIEKALMTRVISKIITRQHNQTLYEIITTLTDLAEQTYEGSRISLSIGIDLSIERTNSYPIGEFFKHDFSKVLSNGIDTIIKCSANGYIINHVKIDDITSEESDILAPIRFAKISEWTNNERGAAILTPNGEILIFYKKKLYFAKRRGYWKYFPHESTIRQLSNGIPKSWTEEIKKSIYLTAIDISFGKTGGCIGIPRNSKKESMYGIINEDDVLETQKGIKSQLFFDITRRNNKIFPNINRLIRKEIAAVDGALVITPQGFVYAAGAILRIDGGSTGGGRTAAAKAMGKHGLGVKISNDGEISFYIDLGSTKEHTIKIG